MPNVGVGWIAGVEGVDFGHRLLFLWRLEVETLAVGDGPAHAVFWLVYDLSRSPSRIRPQQAIPIEVNQVAR